MGAVTTFRTVRLRLLILLTVIGMTAVACNRTPEGRLPVYSVKGKVLYKGSPLAAALVVFEKAAGEAGGTKEGPVSGTVRATGRTEADGSFELMTYQGNDGAPAGDYQVGISSTPPRTESNLLANTPGTVHKGNPDVLRGRYANPKTSGLKAVVKEQANELPPFELK